MTSATSGSSRCIAPMRCLIGAAVLLLLAAGAWWWLAEDWGDPALAAFVHARPPVPIVFTSRTEPASLVAAAPPGEGFVYPGQALWRARAGRLRLLTPRGSVHELTWNKTLPGGGTLVDVMSPSVSPDGTRIVFAGRKGGPDHGHFRLYEVGVDGRGLRPLTGGPSDPGCVALPPMRYGPDGTTVLADVARRAVDYDDVDPIYLNYSESRFCFVSSRTPDLGRGHARRATTLWLMKGDGSGLRPLTANRNNDRWPFLMTSQFLAFSLWSRNTEVITADERDVRPCEPGVNGATAPTDSWLGAFTQSIGSQFGLLVKAHVPVWRPRPLFNGKIVFMTAAGYPDAPVHPLTPLQIMQAEPGLIENVPSARPRQSPLPVQQEHLLQGGPAADANGRLLSLATPGPCPPHHVVLSGAPLGPGRLVAAPGNYALYLADDNWALPAGQPISAVQAQLQLLFDDPEFVDAEPSAVYVRPLTLWDKVPDAVAAGSRADGQITLADGSVYHGRGGQLFNSAPYIQQGRRSPRPEDRQRRRTNLRSRSGGLPEVSGRLRVAPRSFRRSAATPLAGRLGVAGKAPCEWRLGRWLAPRRCAYRARRPWRRREGRALDDPTERLSGKAGDVLCLCRRPLQRHSRQWPTLLFGLPSRA